MYVCMYLDTPIMISQFLIVLELFNALFTSTVCLLSAYFTVSLIPYKFTSQNQMHLLNLQHKQPYSWSCWCAVVLLPLR